MVSAQFLLASPILENPDGYGHYLYIHTLARQSHFPHLDELPVQAGGEAGQFPLYYMLGAALVLPFPDADLNAVAIPNPHGPRQADDNPNVLFHRPFQGFPQGAELAVRLVEAFSVVCGMVVVVCTILLAHLWAPNRPWLWFASGLLPAANPAFAYLAASVTNDMLVAALSSIAIVLMAYWQLRKPAWAGKASAAAVSLAILAKFNAVGLIPVYLAVLFVIERTSRARLLGALNLLLALAIVDGWWMVRNGLLYGDPTGVFALNQHYYGAGYSPFDFSSEHVREVIASLAPTARTFLAMFGRYVITSQFAFAFLGVLTFIGVVAGLLVVLRRRDPLTWLLLGWIALTIAETICNSFVSIVSGGRFLYPALAPIALLVAIGWARLLPAARANVLAAPLLLGSLALAASCAWLVVKPAYAYAPVLANLPSFARPLQATFSEAVELLAVDTPNETYVQPGQRIPVTLYWRLTKPVELPLSTFVHVDSGDPSYSAGVDYEGAPGAGLSPPNFWQPGQIVVDRHSFVLALDSRQDRRNAVPLQVHVGLYYLPPTPNASVQAVSVEPAGAAAQGIAVASWKLEGLPPAPAGPPIVRFGELALLQAKVQESQPGRLNLNLVWRADQKPTRNYTVFVQALSASGQVISQHDSYPLAGRYPTAAWFQGEQVSDSIDLTLPRPAQPDDAVVVGTYVLPNTEPFPTDAGQPFVRLSIGS